jgi:hypothetical protein
MEYTTHPTANLSVLQNYHPTHPNEIIPLGKKPVNKKNKQKKQFSVAEAAGNEEFGPPSNTTPRIDLFLSLRSLRPRAKRAREKPLPQGLSRLQRDSRSGLRPRGKDFLAFA